MEDVVSWDDIKTYDDLYSKACRTAAARTIARATEKCEFLRTASGCHHYLYCGLELKDPWEKHPVGPESPIVFAKRSENILRLSCFNETRCPEYRTKIKRIRKKDEAMLEEICRREKIPYIPPGHEKDVPSESFGHYGSLMGRNFPFDMFRDRGKTNERMLYTFRYGRRVPIICAASFVGRKKTGDRTEYIITLEGDESKEFLSEHARYDLPGGGLKWNERFISCAFREYDDETKKGVKPRGLIGIFERIKRDGKLLWKAVYFGNYKKTPPTEKGGQPKKTTFDSVANMFLGAGPLRVFNQQHLLKSPDIMLAINRVEQGFVQDLRNFGTDLSFIRIGWD